MDHLLKNTVDLFLRPGRIFIPALAAHTAAAGRVDNAPRLPRYCHAYITPVDIPVFWIGFFLCFIIITAAGQHLYLLGKVLELLGKRFKRSKDLFNNIVGKYSTFLQLFFKAKGIQAQ